MSKYSIPVSIETSASHVIGTVECDSLEDYQTKAEELWASQDYDSPTTNCHNEFDLNDWNLIELKEDDLKYYETDWSK